MVTSVRPGGTRAGRARRPGLILLAFALVLLTACGTHPRTVPSAGDSTPPAATGSTPPSPTPSATPSADGTGQGGSASAAAQLAPFLTAASRMDARLRTAAALINGAVRHDTIEVTPQVSAAVRAIDPHALVASMPPGVGPGLTRAVMLVYSDLVSRRAAMRDFASYRRAVSVPRDGYDGRRLVGCLGRGAAAAGRFTGDLTALRDMATASAPVEVTAPMSRNAAELAVRARYIDLDNGGCASCGGRVSTTLARLVWTGGTGGRLTGTVNGIPFAATIHPGIGWQVDLEAC